MLRPSVHLARQLRTFAPVLSLSPLPVSYPQPQRAAATTRWCSQPHWRRSLQARRQGVLVHNRHWSSSEESDQDYTTPRERQIAAAKSSALASLNYRVHARLELEKKLALKGHDPELISVALDQLEEVGVLNDSEYAEAYARGKWRQSRWAPSRIRSNEVKKALSALATQGLLQKGLSTEATEQGLRNVFGSSARNSHVGLQRELEEMEAELTEQAAPESIMMELLEATRRQASLTKGMPPETRRRRLSAWLQRRGHSWATITQLLQRLAV